MYICLLGIPAHADTDKLALVDLSLPKIRDTRLRSLSLSKDLTL